jgi:hypothetical protein
VDQLRSYADERLVAGCVHCGGSPGTQDHVPSRILLDEPYPENLPTVPACASCNAGFSRDEEYFACLVECALQGSVEMVQRPKIARILKDKPLLAAKLAQSRTVARDGVVTFKVEQDRVDRVILKLARGHAAFELSEPQYGPPRHIYCAPLTSLSEETRDSFEGSPSPLMAAWPEVGSRAMMRCLVAEGCMYRSDWIDVQSGRYRYFSLAEGAAIIRIVLSEYLACEVVWEA